MEVIVIESDAFKHLTKTLEKAVDKITDVMAENVELKEDRWMSVEDAAKYVGFERQWLINRKEDIGCFQEGTSIRFKKSDLDAYCKEKYIKRYIYDRLSKKAQKNQSSHK